MARQVNPSSMTLFLAVAAFLAWLYLIFAHGGYWRADQRLSLSSFRARGSEETPPVLAVIPARNEADTIGDVVRAHKRSVYPGPLHLIVVDDQSDDGTAQKARAAWDSAETPTGLFRALEIIEGTAPPSGWVGKMWAVQQGLVHGQSVAPDAQYVLLTDADILLAPSALNALVSKAINQNLSLVSLMARLDARGWGALLIPAFVYFFQQLYPFARVNDPEDETAAAAGGCMLVRANELRDLRGVAPIKDALIDDCALARAVKDRSYDARIWLGLADDEAVSLRDNRSLSSVWKMVERSAYTQLRKSEALLAASMVGMIIIYMAPPFIALNWASHGDFIAFFFALSAWGLMAVSYWPTQRLYARPIWESAFLPVAALFYMAMTITSAYAHWRGRGGAWKGRTYSSNHPRTEK